MSNASDARITILRLIADAPEPITGPLIRQHPSMHEEDATRISNILFNIKRDGQATKDAAGGYALTAKGRGAIGDAGAGVAVEHRRSAKSPTPLEERLIKRKRNLSTRGVIEARLQQLTSETQDALDLYLASVGDPGVFGPLKRARDEAASALRQFRAVAKES